MRTKETTRQRWKWKEDPDADHVPLGGRGPEYPPDGAGGLEGRVRTVFSLERRRHRFGILPKAPDDGGDPGQWRKPQRVARKGVLATLRARASHSFEEGGESLPNLGTTEVYLSGTSPEGAVTRCKCSFNVAAVQRCLLSTGRAMAQGNAHGQGGSALPPGREVLALSGAGEPAYPLSGCFLRTCVRPAPREFKPTTAFFKGLGEAKHPQGMAFAALVGGEPKGKEP